MTRRPLERLKTAGGWQWLGPAGKGRLWLGEGLPALFRWVPFLPATHWLLVANEIEETCALEGQLSVIPFKQQTVRAVRNLEFHAVSAFHFERGEIRGADMPMVAGTVVVDMIVLAHACPPGQHPGRNRQNGLPVVVGVPSGGW